MANGLIHIQQEVYMELMETEKIAIVESKLQLVERNIYSLVIDKRVGEKAEDPIMVQNAVAGLKKQMIMKGEYEIELKLLQFKETSETK